jgi:hypothetical protein
MIIHQAIYNFVLLGWVAINNFYIFLVLFQVPAKHGFLKRRFMLEQYSFIGINGHELEINFELWDAISE